MHARRQCLAPTTRCFRRRIEPFALIGGLKRLAGVLVGNRTMAERLVAAFAHLATGRHVGKVVVRIA
ncbi:hypothetical protein LK996_16130 [Lysobacter sp. A6]|uniref:Zinc-binding dehydrogenase n=1 Tax=Noviluteimonas lactosilytica TaxID=2888523 RepID=A0ABS8JLU5_9GAMM|nr:hypothetical protein [Lysobacter lactosilyticus]MCC8364600.1 hypothetical protein [Lysobacter lactosilyticus]